MQIFKIYADSICNINDKRIIHRPLVVNGNIWYLIYSNLYNKHNNDGKAEWIKYDINNNQHCIMCLFPKSISCHFNDYTVYNDNIYLFGVEYKNGPIIFNTKTFNHCIEILNNSNMLKCRYFLENCSNINGDIYLFASNTNSKCFIYNIDKQKYGVSKDVDIKIIDIIYDSKQKQWIVISPSYKNLCDLFINIRLLRATKECEIQIDKNIICHITDWYIPYVVEQGFIVCYNNYIISFGARNHCIFILDLIMKHCHILKSIKSPHSAEYFPVIVDEPNGITQCIIKQYIASIIIPNDIYLLIALFYGDYYDKTIHLFQSDINYGDKYHVSISLGVIINQYMNEQKIENDEIDAIDIFDKIQSINNQKKGLIEEMMEKYKRLKEENLMLKNRLKMYEK